MVMVNLSEKSSCFQVPQHMSSLVYLCHFSLHCHSHIFPGGQVYITGIDLLMLESKKIHWKLKRKCIDQVLTWYPPLQVPQLEEDHSGNMSTPSADDCGEEGAVGSGPPPEYSVSLINGYFFLS